MKKASITKDTVVLSVISVALQGLSLLLNIFITKKLGEADGYEMDFRRCGRRYKKQAISRLKYS